VSVLGEEAIEAPWQARLVATTLAFTEARGLRGDFRRHLIAAIAAAPEAPYYESWLVAFEALLRDREVIG